MKQAGRTGAGKSHPRLRAASQPRMQLAQPLVKCSPAIEKVSSEDGAMRQLAHGLAAKSSDCWTGRIDKQQKYRFCEGGRKGQTHRQPESVPQSRAQGRYVDTPRSPPSRCPRTRCHLPCQERPQRPARPHTKETRQGAPLTAMLRWPSLPPHTLHSPAITLPGQLCPFCSLLCPFLQCELSAKTHDSKSLWGHVPTPTGSQGTYISHLITW